MEQQKRKVGRPAAEKPKDNRITIRMNDEDYSAFKSYAQAHSQTATQVIMAGLEKLYSEES